MLSFTVRPRDMLWDVRCGSECEGSREDEEERVYVDQRKSWRRGVGMMSETYGGASLGVSPRVDDDQS